MTRKEAKRVVCDWAWMVLDTVRGSSGGAAEIDGISEADQERIEDATEELLVELCSRGKGEFGIQIEKLEGGAEG